MKKKKMTNFSHMDFESQTKWVDFGLTAVPRPLCSGNRDLRAHEMLIFRQMLRTRQLKCSLKIWLDGDENGIAYKGIRKYISIKPAPCSSARQSGCHILRQL